MIQPSLFPSLETIPSPWCWKRCAPKSRASVGTWRINASGASRNRAIQCLGCPIHGEESECFATIAKLRRDKRDG